jgi:hypothetical protein
MHTRLPGFDYNQAAIFQFLSGNHNQQARVTG